MSGSRRSLGGCRKTLASAQRALAGARFTFGPSAEGLRTAHKRPNFRAASFATASWASVSNHCGAARLAAAVCAPRDAPSFRPRDRVSLVRHGHRAGSDARAGHARRDRRDVRRARARRTRYAEGRPGGAQPTARDVHRRLRRGRARLLRRPEAPARRHVRDQEDVRRLRGPRTRRRARTAHRARTASPRARLRDRAAGHGPKQTRAQRMYERAGYAPVANFNANPVATFFGEKRL